MSGAQYPHAAGFRGSLPSGRAAAEAITPQLGRRQGEVLADLEANGPSTSEEIGKRIERHWYLVRPRLSELKALGLVTATGAERPSQLGGMSTEWRLTTADERSHAAALAALADVE